MLDRIDYNMEKAESSISEGHRQLQKAERYQRGSRKMLIIIVLTVAILVLFVALIFFKL